jgi:hypothetical protein
MSASAFYLLPFWRWQQQAVLRPPAWAASRATASAAAPRIEVPFLEMKSVIQIQPEPGAISLFKGRIDTSKEIN